MADHVRNQKHKMGQQEPVSVQSTLILAKTYSLSIFLSEEDREAVLAATFCAGCAPTSSRLRF